MYFAMTTSLALTEVPSFRKASGGDLAVVERLVHDLFVGREVNSLLGDGVLL
jgi:hypothetical protein